MKFSDDIVKHFARLNTPSVKKLMQEIISKCYDKSNIIIGEDTGYIIAKGEIPVTLVAHMDTVFSKPAYEFFHDEKANVLWSPQGLGADDHAGLTAIWFILAEGYRPHIILTDKEETGGIGALQLIKDYPTSPFNDLKFIIELDRQGEKDCVFYNCENKEFEKYIETFGFETAVGTFTDISIICPVWKIAGVNLSIGYFHEHTLGEYLNLTYHTNTINNVKNILDNVINTECPQYKYIPAVSHLYNYDYYGSQTTAYDMSVKCDNCGKLHDYWDMVEISGETADETDFVCYDCFAQMQNIKLCPYCNDWYKERKDKNMCKKCEVKNKNGKAAYRL